MLKENVLYVETITVKRVMYYVWKHAFRILTKTSCVINDVILVLKIVATYSMCAHTGAPKRFFVIFAKRTVWILIYVDVITFQINLLYFVI